MSRKKIILIVVASLAATAVLAAAIVLLAVNLTQPVVDRGDEFMKAIQNHDTDAAYAMFTTELQANVTPSTFAEFFGAADVKSWTYSQRVIRNGLGYLTGQATIDDQTYNFELNFIDRDGKWQLDGYKFNQ